MATQNLLAQVKEGMLIVDSAGESVGTVREVYFGTYSDEAEALTATHVVGADRGIEPDVADTIEEGSDLPDVLRRRLLTHGYIRIDGGMLTSDRYALGGQVAAVAEDTVRLNVPRDELIN